MLLLDSLLGYGIEGIKYRILSTNPQKVAFRSVPSDWLLSCQRLGARGEGL